jgi:hypothetical protein
MARRHDSGWRDSRLNIAHAAYGMDLPVAGMDLPMVEYDRGEALAVINYVRRDRPLPQGPEVGRAFRAVGQLRRDDGARMPFLSAQYDPRNWAMRLLGHNDPARDLLGTSGWLPVTEQHFARLLYRLRGRTLPDLTSYGVTFSTAPWLQYEGGMSPVGWPGQDMSVRRRAYEPEVQQGAATAVHRVAFSIRMPCTDVDLAVVGRSGAVTLLVDYKLDGAYIDPKHKTHRAMSGIRGGDGRPVPSLITRYNPNGDHWKFHALALNEVGEQLLLDVLKRTRAMAAGATELNDWVYLDEPRWVELLEQARAA